MKKTSVFLLCTLFFLLIHNSIANAQYRPYYRDYSKVFRLRGEIDLGYERKWGDTDESSEFTHEYTLGLQGFVIDPRLMSFDAEGSFYQEINDPHGNTDFYEFGTTLSFLNAKPRRGILRHFPQPIRLRFNYYNSEDIEGFRYGISLTYTRPERFSFFSKGKIISVEKDTWPFLRNLNNLKNTNNNLNNLNAGQIGRRRGIPFPVFNLDYDRYTFTRSNIESDQDRFSIRADTKFRNIDFTAEYQYYSYGGSFDTEEQRLDLRADYLLMEKEKSLNIFNRLYYVEINEGKNLDLSSRTNWAKRLGSSLRNSIIVNGGGRYFTSDVSSFYLVDASTSYHKHFSERLLNIITGTVSYGETDEDIYTVTIQNKVDYQISKILEISNQLSAGINERGPSYQFGIGLNVRTRISAGISYSFLHSTLSERGRGNISVLSPPPLTSSETDRVTNSHILQLNLSARLLRHMFFTSRNSYRINDVDDGESFQEKLLTLRGDLFWNISRFRFNLGALYSALEKTGDRVVDTTTTTLHSTVSTMLLRRMYLALRAAYLDSNTGQSSIEINPVMSWSFRRVFFNAEYEMRITKEDNIDEQETNHRVFLRLSRRFFKTIRPFW
jgi:hypothetical protein